jgi:hypothetical protein
LAHIGIELLLKAWHLQVFVSFPGIHSLVDLWNEIDMRTSPRQLRPRSIRALELLDQYEQLRYPRANSPIEIGSEDFPKVKGLVESLYLRMPQEMLEAHNNIDVLSKGGRLLMKRPIGKA